MRSSKGFTLAEVLITLTIIGVVAAMTIPTLMSKYQKQQYAVGLKKAYSTLSNAIKMVPISNNCPADDFKCAGMDTNTSEQNLSLIAQQLNNSTFIPNHQEGYCKTFAQKMGFEPDIGACIITADGITFMSYNSDILVDINGPQGPNKFGRDRFAFVVNLLNTSLAPSIPAGAVIPYGSFMYTKLSNDNTNTPYWKEYCTTELINNTASNDYSYATPAYCTGRVLEEGAMNY